jgi:hypothetical protein
VSSAITTDFVSFFFFAVKNFESFQKQNLQSRLTQENALGVSVMPFPHRGHLPKTSPLPFGAEDANKAFLSSGTDLFSATALRT